MIETKTNKQTKNLTGTGVPFETEAELRHRGTARTPDILLCTPLGIQITTSSTTESNNNNKNKTNDSSCNSEWKTIAWIDSKVRCYEHSTLNSLIVRLQIVFYVLFNFLIIILMCWIIKLNVW